MQVIENLPAAHQKAESDVTAPFKICSMCLKAWDDSESFIRDPELVVNGFQAFFDQPENGLILFTHRRPGCHSTLAIKAGSLKGLYHGPFYDHLNHGSATCIRACVDHNNLERCDAECSMHWVREVLQVLRKHRAI